MSTTMKSALAMLLHHIAAKRREVDELTTALAAATSDLENLRAERDSVVDYFEANAVDWSDVKAQENWKEGSQ